MAKYPMPFPEVEEPGSYLYPQAKKTMSPVGSFGPSVYPKKDPEAYTAPFTPYTQGQGALRDPNMPSPYQNPNYGKAPNKDIQTLGYVAPIQAGLGAGSQVTATPDATDAALQVAGSTFAGAGSGALTGAAIGAAGGPIGAVGGAVIGGITGLVSGGIQAYAGLKSARNQQRKAEKVMQELKAREDKRIAEQKIATQQARADAKENQKYNRRQVALQSQWSAMQSAGRKFNEIMAGSEGMRSRVRAGGR